MSHFSATYAGHTSCFTHAERRKVIVEHEILPLLTLIALQTLTVVRSSQRRRHEGLRFAAGKECGSMGAWQYAGLNADRPDLVKLAAIGANAALGDLFAEAALD